MDIEQEIRQLDNLIKEMSGLVLSNLKYALSVYEDYDPIKDYKMVDDTKVNAYERLIETECLQLMTKERLYAEDLRKVTGIMSLVQDIERLGDHAKDVLQFSLRLAKPNKDNKQIISLINFVMNMVHDSIYSYINRDILLAREIIKRDDHVDFVYEEILLDLIKDEEKNNKLSSNYTVYTALVVKYLERIADHSTNIAEWVIYIINGYYKDKQII